MSAELKLEKALLEAGLPTDLTKIVGKNFLFQDEDDDDIIVGTITGINISEGELTILIAPLKTWGGSINHIRHCSVPGSDKTWMVEVDTSGGGYEYEDYSGDFRILPSA